MQLADWVTCLAITWTIIKLVTMINLSTCHADLQRFYDISCLENVSGWIGVHQDWCSRLSNGSQIRYRNTAISPLEGSINEEFSSFFLMMSSVLIRNLVIHFENYGNITWIFFILNDWILTVIIAMYSLNLKRFSEIYSLNLIVHSYVGKNTASDVFRKFHRWIAIPFYIKKEF